MTDLAALNQTDDGDWARRNADLLRRRWFAELDIDHLLDALSEMSKSERSGQVFDDDFYLDAR